MSARRLVAGVVGLALAASTLSACGFHGLYSTPLPGGASLGSHPYTVNVQFADVLDLVPQSAVKVNDVSVGRVKSIALDGWSAMVTVQVNGDVVLPANARAELLQTSLLGEKYVALEQPTTSAPEGRLTDGATIPISRTGRNPEVEEVLGALSLLLNGGGLQQLQTINHELNLALGGHEDQARDVLSQLQTFVGTLDKQKDEITTAIVNLDVLARTLNEQKQILIDTLNTLPQALEVLASQRNQFVTLLQSLSNLGSVASRVIAGSQTNLTNALKQLQPVLSTLAAAGQDLPNALQILLTYPFPQNVTGAVKGDYNNLSASLDLDLTDILNNLLGTPATGGTAAQTATVAPVLPGVTG